MRRYLIGGNWKCNGTLDFARTFPQKVLAPLEFNASKVDVVVAPNNLHMGAVQQALAGSKV